MESPPPRTAEVFLANSPRGEVREVSIRPPIEQGDRLASLRRQTAQTVSLAFAFPRAEFGTRRFAFFGETWLTWTSDFGPKVLFPSDGCAISARHKYIEFSMCLTLRHIVPNS